MPTVYVKDTNHTPPTKKQKDYMLILFNDLDFTHESRNAWLGWIVKRPILFLDDLRFFEATDVINRLKKIRENKK